MTECNCCGYKAKHLNATQDRIDGEEQNIYLCDICYNTHLYNIVKYHDEPNVSMAISVAWIGNMILDVIKESKSE